MSFTRFVTSIANGSAPAKVVSEVTAEQYASVFFMVRSENLDECEAVSKTIAKIFNSFIHNFHNENYGDLKSIIRNHRDWSEDQEHETGSHYVYAYGVPKKYAEWKISEPSYKNDLDNYQIFYIGRGINTRLYDHVSEVIDGISKRAPNQFTPLEFGKAKFIEEFLLRESRDNGKQIVRKIAKFNGKYAEAQYAAAEYFLINYWCGVYSLENLTRGDNTIKGSTSEWLCRSKRVNSDTPAWKKIISEFPHSGIKAATQSLKCKLVKAEVSAEFKEFPLSSLLKDTSNIVIENGGLVTDNGTDTYYLLTLCNALGIQILNIQLKLSDKYTGVCFNIRPLNGDSSKNFTKKIADMFFSGSDINIKTFIKSPCNKPYFKPCAKDGANGKKDTWFDFRKPGERGYDISNTPLAAACRITSNQSLYTVLQHFTALAKTIN